jgi:hypothetical protein
MGVHTVIKGLFMKKKEESETGGRKKSSSKTRGKDPDGRRECLCLQCGISNYLVLEDLPLDVLGPSETKILSNIFCSECGGPLLVRGAAGEEPFYPTQ